MTTPIAVARTMGERVVVRNLDEVQIALRRIADERGMSRETIDGRAEWASGYAAKLLAMIPTKKLGPTSTTNLLRALGKRMVLEDDPEALAQIGDLLNGRVENNAHAYLGSMKLKTLSYVNKVAVRVIRRDRKKWGKRANQQRTSKLSPEHRSRIAKIAAHARWRKYRKARKEAAKRASSVHGLPPERGRPLGS